MPTYDDFLSFGSVNSPIGNIYAAAAGDRVVCLSFTCPNKAAFHQEVSRLLRKPAVFSDDVPERLLLELQEYFDGTRMTFTYSPEISRRSSFQRKVLEAASRIAYGEKRTYAWLAEQAGSPAAARAAGQVMASNPVPIIIPCHRVIASSGKLGGFAGGLRALDLKKFLLELEQEASLKRAKSKPQALVSGATL
jgi:methylated-DNA-[protein]-cysteine S-methyltransferase